jgi:hypothetical protein
MGKLNMGILGGFSGAVGTVVGSSNRKGDDIIRVKTKKPRTSNSEGQANQRTKFSLVTVFMQGLNFILKIGFKGVAGDVMSPYNYACKKALKDAVTGTAPDYELDYSKVLISDGDLSLVLGATAELVEGKVNFQWEDNSGNCKGEPTDAVILVVYNADNNEVSFSMGKFTRAMKSGIVPIPYSVTGDNLLFYLFLQSVADPLVVSTSLLVGSAIQS